MRIPLKGGRTFEARDRKDSNPVMMINQTFAEKYFPHENPLGQRLNVGSDADDGKPPREIIGIVGTAKHENLAEPDAPEFYIPFAQNPDRYMDLVVRTSAGDAGRLGNDDSPRRARDRCDSSLCQPSRLFRSWSGKRWLQARFNTGLLAIFAIVAIILAAVGIYGVIAYSVVQRTREIGIRMALGAQRKQMLTMILRQSLMMAAIGIAVGLFGAFGATRLLSALLFGVGTTDLPTYAAVVLLLGAAALLAGFLPARRAMKVDPGDCASL